MERKLSSGIEKIGSYDDNKFGIGEIFGWILVKP